MALAEESETPTWVPEVRAAMEAALAESEAPGLSVVIVEHGEIVISEAIGNASIVGPMPMSRKTVLRTGALGDLGINLALLRLSDAGQLDLDAPIGNYTDVHPAIGRVTANQLISHTGGLRANHFTQPLWQDADLARTVKGWDERLFVAEPGEAYSHSHYSIALAGHLVESLAGKPFSDAMRELVWDPIGAPSATVRIENLLSLPIGQGHWMREGEMAVIEPLGMGFIGWPNSLFASLDDLDRIALALAEPENGGRVRGDRAGKAPWTASTSWGGVSFVAMVDVERRFCALMADNAWAEQRALPRIARAIWQVALGQEPPEPRLEITWSPASPDVHEALVGVYENETTLEISIHDGKLMLESGPSAEEVTQGGDNLFRAPIMIVQDFPIRPLTFSVEASDDQGRARLLRIGSRVWARR